MSEAEYWVLTNPYKNTQYMDSAYEPQEQMGHKTTRRTQWKQSKKLKLS